VPRLENRETWGTRLPDFKLEFAVALNGLEISPV